MRLLNANTLQLELFPDPFRDSDLFPYAILSHTWETDEVTFDDMKDISVAKSKLGFAKIEAACQPPSSTASRTFGLPLAALTKYSPSQGLMMGNVHRVAHWPNATHLCIHAN